MLRTSLIVFAVFLTTTSAFNPDFYRNFYNPSYVSSPLRRSDEGEDFRLAKGFLQPSFRATNERSIPYKTTVQRVRVTNQAHSNTSHKIGNSIVKNFPTVANRRGGPSESDSAVVFPGPTSRRKVQENEFVPEVPESCEKLGLCEDVPNYPHKYVDELIAKAGNLKFFNIDILTPEISRRAGPDKEVLCESREQLIYPKAARNIDGQWVYILNKKQVPVQGFKIEICKAPDKQCNRLAYVEEKYKLECGQKSTQRSMWSVNATGYMVLEIVSTPSCCSCVIRDNKT